jgi:hypothetical protein
MPENIPLVTIYQLILYKKIGQRWHYVRLTNTPDHQIVTETGCCGQAPDSTVLLRPDSVVTDPVSMLRQEAEKWATAGYHKPHQNDLQIMTLHFQMQRWRGYPAGAPWYDDWVTGYLDPIEAALAHTKNGIPRGNERFSGNYLHHYAIFNSDLALEAVEKIAAAAPVKFLLDIHIGRREKQVQIPIDPNVPEYLRSLFRIVEKSARTIASELPVLFPGDSMQPELVPDHSFKRVLGEESLRLRQLLKEKWNFDSSFWDPLTQASPSEVVFLNGMPEDKKQQIVGWIRQRMTQPLYLIDCETGLFEIGPEQIFSSAHEGMVFDASLEWVIYFSHHYTLTFGGEWLIEAVKEMYSDTPELLNNW